MKPPHSRPVIGSFMGQPVLTAEVFSAARQEKFDAPDETLSSKAHRSGTTYRRPCPPVHAEASTGDFHGFRQYLKVTARHDRYKLHL